MKNTLLALLLMLAIPMFVFAGGNHDGDHAHLTVNAEKSKLVWTGYKVLGNHTGEIAVKEGMLHVDADGNLTGGKFVIDMGSVSCTDLEGETAGKLVGHLKSEDFFGVEKYPTATFEIVKVVSRGKDGDYKIIGNLTIKETTEMIKFNAMITPVKGEGLTAKTKLTIDRTDYDIRYGSGSFFDKLGDKTIYDEFELDITLVAAEQIAATKKE